MFEMACSIVIDGIMMVVETAYAVDIDGRLKQPMRLILMMPRIGD
jgi:hypothetical protein